MEEAGQGIAIFVLIRFSKKEKLAFIPYVLQYGSLHHTGRLEDPGTCLN